MDNRTVIFYESKWSNEAKRNVHVEVGVAIFHQFGVDYEEFENGPGMFSVAIIETPDGQVKMVRADMIRFTVKP